MYINTSTSSYRTASVSSASSVSKVGITAQSSADAVNNAAAVQQKKLSSLAVSLQHVLSFTLPRKMDFLSVTIRNFALDEYGEIKEAGDYDIRKTVEDMAQSYVFLKKGIEEDKSVSDAEKQERLATLDEQFETGLDEFLKYYDVSMNPLLEDLNLSYEGDLHDSFKAIVKDRIDQISEFAESDYFKEYVSKNNVDLSLGFDEFSSALKKAEELYMKDVESGTIKPADNIFAAEEGEETAGGFFNLNALAAIHSAAKTFERFDKPDISASEEQIAFTFAVKSMAALDAAKAQSSDADFISKLSAGLLDMMEESVKDHNQLLRDKAKDAEETQKGGGARYADLDMSKISSVYQEIMQGYAAGKDTVQSMIEGFTTAESSFRSSAESSPQLIRYNSSAFFDNFFKASKEQPYAAGVPAFKTFASILSNVRVDTGV